MKADAEVLHVKEGHGDQAGSICGMMQAGLRIGKTHSSFAAMGQVKTSRWGDAVSEGVHAARSNLLPGSLLIVCGILLVVGYYQVSAARDALDWLGGQKERLGIWFAIPSTAFFGGIIPLVFRRVFLKQSSHWRDVVFQALFWAEKGMEVDLFYRLQNHVFGEGVSLFVLLPKVVVDQFVYVPFIAMPSIVLGYLWKECGFSLAEIRAALRYRSYWERSFPLMISNWAIWIPAVALIYSFPLALQLPLQNITLTLWVMLLILLTGERRNDA
ncbi:MAG: Mpv17/PMP22 family protein [Puniceicoccales bacterium]